jgi:hypothetical protein
MAQVNQVDLCKSYLDGDQKPNQEQGLTCNQYSSRPAWKR